MYKYFLVSWSILGTNTCQKRGIKPAWKLIQTFKVQISYFFGSVVRFWNHSVPSNATIKPYIQNIISEKKGFLKLLPIPRSALVIVTDINMFLLPNSFPMNNFYPPTNSWTSPYWKDMLSFCFLTSGQQGGNTWDPNYTLGVDFLTTIFYNLKKVTSRSIFILSSLDVGHWAAQTQPFFDKLPEITDFGLLQQS